MLLFAFCKDNQLLNDQRILRCFSVRTFLCQLLHTSNVTSGWQSALFLTSGWKTALFFLEFRFVAREEEETLAVQITHVGGNDLGVVGALDGVAVEVRLLQQLDQSPGLGGK